MSTDTGKPGESAADPAAGETPVAPEDDGQVGVRADDAADTPRRAARTEDDHTDDAKSETTPDAAEPSEPEPHSSDATLAGLLLEPDLPPPASVPRPVFTPAPRLLPMPKVSDVTPAEGPVRAETRVTLRGEHLHRESIVRFAGVIAMTVGAREPHELTVTTPPREQAGAVDVTLQNPGAPLVTLAEAFRYVALPAPKITSVAPHQGAVKGGTEISVTGQNFVAGSVVLVDGTAARTTFVDATTLEARTPPGKAGAMVDVAVDNPDGKRAVVKRAFAYDERYG